MRAQDPKRGFDVVPPQGFEPLDRPDAVRALEEDGRRIGIRIYTTTVSVSEATGVLVSVSEDSAHKVEGWIERHETYTGSVELGRPVAGATGVWEFYRPAPSGIPSTMALVVTLADGTVVYVNGTNIDGVEVLYRFLTAIHDAPGSLPEPD